jgi:hypothetical protein
MHTGEPHLSPLSSLFKYARDRLSGRVHYPRDRMGMTVETRWGQPEIIKQIIVDDPGHGDPGAVFMVRFHLKNMSPGMNKIFLELPMRFIVGLPGFRSKLWLYDPDSGDFQGLYEWNTVRDARNYAHSFAARFMKNRSLSGAEYAVFDRKTGQEIESGLL